MTLDELRAWLRKEQHLNTYVPWAVPAQVTGWYVVISDSEYAPGGFSVWVSDPHYIIVGSVAQGLEAAGLDVQWQEYRSRMEAWPRVAGRDRFSTGEK